VIATSEVRVARGVRRIAPEGMKVCGRCEQTKPLDDFPRATGKLDGRFGYCTVCTRARNGERTPEARRRWHLKQKYGMTVEEYDELLARQGGACATCRQPPPDRPRRPRDPLVFFPVDHDHRTGRVRGLLCFRCNTVLGQVDDDVELLQSLIEYLRSC